MTKADEFMWTIFGLIAAIFAAGFALWRDTGLDILMAVLFPGTCVALVGEAIAANAAFSDRAQFGSIICLIGLLLIVGGAIEMLF